MRKLCCLLLLVFASPVFGAHFQDSNGYVIVRDGVAEFRCPSSEFPGYEATYEAPPNGAIRIWTGDYAALQKDGTQYGDPFYTSERFATYVGNLAAYQAAYDLAHVTPTPTPQPTIYADVQVSADRVKVNGETLTFQAWLKDGDGNVLPVTESWIIRLRDADGEEVDAIEVQFTDGATPAYQYAPPTDSVLGRVFVKDDDFDLVDVPGVGTFKVELLVPVEFTIYRSLQ